MVESKLEARSEVENLGAEPELIYAKGRKLPRDYGNRCLLLAVNDNDRLLNQM